MFRRLTTAALINPALVGVAWSEHVDAKKQNTGEAGTMVFLPALANLAIGVSTRLVATDKGHNAETVKGILSEGTTALEGKINEELNIAIDLPGLCAVRCTPHFAMGTVKVVAVGEDAAVPEGFLEGRIPKKAKKRLEAALADL